MSLISTFSDTQNYFIYSIVLLTHQLLCTTFTAHEMLFSVSEIIELMNVFVLEPELLYCLFSITFSVVFPFSFWC